MTSDSASLSTAALAPPALRLPDVLRILRRRRRPLLVASAVVMTVALVAALLWPPTYRSVGTILIEQQELPADMVRSAISSYADQRIQVISQRVMTTRNLLQIIEQNNLYRNLRQTAPREVVLKRMRDDISFEMISAEVIDPRAGRPTKATIAFSVGYSHRSPAVAARVANELVSLYLRVNIESRRQDAASAADFMRDEAQSLARRIDELQARLATFKQLHLNELPEQSLVNTQMLNRVDDDVRDTQTQQRALDQQLAYLDSQLAQLNPSSQVFTATGERVLSPSDRLKFLRTESSRVATLYGPDHPDVLRVQREIAGLEQDGGRADAYHDLSRQIQDAETRMATARERYAPEHPDLQRLERELEAMYAERGQSPGSRPSTGREKADNPAFISIQVQREALLNERKSLDTKLEELRRKSSSLESRIARSPSVERDHAALIRELETAQISYRLVHQKQVEAQQSKNLEDEHKGERFTLIEPPVPPEQPASPNRLALLVAGLLLAPVAAALATATVEGLDPHVRDRRDLQLLLGCAPLAVVPRIETIRDLAQRATARRRMLAGVVAVVVTAPVLIHFLYMPLDVLIRVVLRRFGV